jgi:hypothetical protein
MCFHFFIYEEIKYQGVLYKDNLQMFGKKTCKEHA